MTNKDNGGIDIMYVNTLISLQENISTYGIDGQKVSGHVTLSSPGVIRCYVQNLKPHFPGQNFTLCIFSKSRRAGVKIGQLGMGRETRWLVNEMNILDKGLKLDEIDGVAVIADNGMRGSEAVLLGFSQEKYMIMSIIDELFPRKLVAKPVEEANSAKVQAQASPPVVKPSLSNNKIDNKINNKVKEEIKNKIQNETQKEADRENTFILPKGAVVKQQESSHSAASVVESKPHQQAENKGSDSLNDSLESELKRIIEALSKDQVLKQKAQSLQDQIEKISGEPQVHTARKPHIEKTLERLYVSKQGQIQSVPVQEVEEEQDEFEEKTNPKEAVSSVIALKESEQAQEAPESSSAQEERIAFNQEEIDYLMEIDKKLQEIKNRLQYVHEEER